MADSVGTLLEGVGYFESSPVSICMLYWIATAVLLIKLFKFISRMTSKLGEKQGFEINVGFRCLIIRILLPGIWFATRITNQDCVKSLGTFQRFILYFIE